MKNLAIEPESTRSWQEINDAMIAEEVALEVISSLMGRTATLMRQAEEQGDEIKAQQLRNEIMQYMKLRRSMGEYGVVELIINEYAPILRKMNGN